MRTVIQRVTHASCTVDNKITGQIGRGFLILVGFTDGDNEALITSMAHRIAHLRIFDDENDKMNWGLEEVGGSVLSISQFTLYGDANKGNRPSFVKAMRGEYAEPLYHFFNDCLRKEGLHVEEGIFGADMKIELLNDGPITIIMDREGEKNVA